MLRPGRAYAWLVRCVALAVLLQAGSPAFVSACERSAGGGEHGCPACRPATAPRAPSEHPACHAEATPVPACHAAQAPVPAPPAPPATQPCCFLDATPPSGQTAVPEVTLSGRDAQPLPLDLSGDPDGKTSVRSAQDRFLFPPGFAELTGSGPPETLRHTVLRL